MYSLCEIHLCAAEKFCPNEGRAEGGFGGNSALPEPRAEYHHRIEFRQFLPSRRNPPEQDTVIPNQKGSRAKQKRMHGVLLGRIRHSRSGGTALAGCRGAEAVAWRNSFVLEVGSSKVYNQSTSSNFLKIKRVERFLLCKNRIGVFAKTLSAYGGSREIP